MPSKQEIVSNGIRQWILDTLLPYKQDRTLCAVNSNGRCEYLTSDGKKCAIGKYMKEGDWQYYDNSIGSLYDSFTHFETIFVDEALPYILALDINDLVLIQNYHDRIACNYDSELIEEVVDELEKSLNIKLDELRL